MANVELQDVELFVFIDNMVSKSVFYKGTSEIPFLFKLVLRLHQVQTRGCLIQHVVHIVGPRMVEANICAISRVNNLGVMMI